MRPLATASTLLLLLLAPAVASADKSTAPPGNSGISQYVEVVPSAGGGKPSKDQKQSRNPLPQREQRKLSGAGAVGDQLARVVARTSPAIPASVTATTTHKSSKKGRKHGGGTGSPKTTSSSSADGEAKQLAAAYAEGPGGGGEGSGIGVPLILIMASAALAVGGLAVARRGARGDGPESEL
jgi:hypothetical protein